MAFVVSARSLTRYAWRYRGLFSWARLLNFVAVLASLALSRMCRRPVVWGRPFMLMVEPSSFCNLRCPLCPSGNGTLTRQRGHMDLEGYRRLVDQTRRHVFMIMLWNQGEPFLNRHLSDMVRYAHDRRIFTCTSTNGHFIEDPEAARAVVASGLDELIVSVDGMDQQTYARYRVGGDLERVFAGIGRLLAARAEAGASTPVVSLQFLAMRHNEAQLAAAQDTARRLGVDKFLVKTTQVYSPEQADKYLPQRPAYRRYEAAPGGSLRVKGQPAKGCSVLWYSSTVNWDGTVAPCCFDKDAQLPLGDAFAAADFGQLWRGPAYQRLRSRVLADRSAIPMCSNCSEGYRGMFSHVEELTG